jgi:pantoate--beta-alanine ligase
MKIVKTIQELAIVLRQYRNNGQTLGLVPTMGALHDGHISLVRKAKEKCQKTAVSIFVNPRQFNNPSDLEKYPKTINNDIQLLEEACCDLLFIPEAQEMYPFEHDLNMSFGELEKNLEGKFRPGHFQGVGIVVSKLFNIFQPQAAFFGQKDIQQYFIIKKLIDQLSYRTELVMVETARESNGLAMSSRNLRLSAEQRNDAGLIYQCLMTSDLSLKNGTAIDKVRQNAIELFSDHPRFELEYFEVVETKDFNPIAQIKKNDVFAICVAAHLGDVRLIDNLILNS